MHPYVTYTTHTFRHHLEQQTWSWVPRGIQLCSKRLVVYFSKTLGFNLDSKRCKLSGTYVWTWWHYTSAWRHNSMLGRLMLYKVWRCVDDMMLSPSRELYAIKQLTSHALNLWCHICIYTYTGLCHVADPRYVCLVVVWLEKPQYVNDIWVYTRLCE